ncbi:MAG TPA: S53 family peptidase [Candidatus Binataceae bacterium]|nr:S53 family peptidase [Candidatus Binataceae bacterium]
MEDTAKHQATTAGASANRGVHSYVHYPASLGAKRPNCKPYFKLARSRAAAAADVPWNVPDLCAAYSWPAPGSVPGGGVIAIVELGGGWVQADMNQFFGSINQPLPQITDVSVDGTKNSPAPDPNGDDGEVALDIQVAAAAYYVATSQPATIRVYWAQDIASAVRAATADGCDVCSISWGSDEANWGAAAGQDMEQAATDATTAGMVVFAASGDNDSSDGGPNAANVDLPSSCPHVIGCGGTSKTATTETVWNNNPGNPSGEGTGGGYSTLFTPMPTWQAGAGPGPGRMVPDVSADADPNTGYNIVLHGAPLAIGGTSAVAPLYAGLFASFGTKLHFVTPELYLNQVCFNDITVGDNGAFRAVTGPDPCTGIGSPIGTRLAKLLAHPAATPSRQLRNLEAENARLRQVIADLTRA